MAKNDTYPLHGPRYPLLVPVPNTPANQSAWREWGRSPKPGVISIGLPRPHEVTPAVPSLWDRRVRPDDGPMIRNGRTAWMLDELMKEQGN